MDEPPSDFSDSAKLGSWMPSFGGITTRWKHSSVSIFLWLWFQFRFVMPILSGIAFDPCEALTSSESKECWFWKKRSTADQNSLKVSMFWLQYSAVIESLHSMRENWGFAANPLLSDHLCHLTIHELQSWVMSIPEWKSIVHWNLEA
jgi:hypothetical protein